MRSYSKEELCVIFGVSVVSINKWIEEGRFIGISCDNQDQINELTLWASVTPGLITVREVQGMYEKNQERFRSGGHDDED